MPASAARPLAAAAFLLLAAATAFAQDTPTKEVQDHPALPHWRDPGLVAAEIVGFEVLLNRINYCCGSGNREDYHVTMESIRRNLRSGWTVDHDPFSVNQLGHPYSGSMYYGFARSAGYNFWESGGFAVAGSALWEIA